MASGFLGVLGLKAQQVRVQACVEAQNWMIVVGWSNVASGKDDHRSDFRVALARWFCQHSRHTWRHELNGGSVYARSRVASAMLAHRWWNRRRRLAGMC